MFKKERENIRIFALGGLGEVGKNMYVVEVGTDIFVLDSGLMPPEDEMFGVDAVIPETQYLNENKERVRGVFLTHGHEDHIGALPYIVDQLRVPVYGTKLTLGLLKKRLKMRLSKKADLKEIHADSVLKFGGTLLSFFHTTHNIPGSLGICIHTNQGAIVYTGDFKVDQTPVNGIPTEFDKLAKIGKEGVLCLLSDSTNAEISGLTPSESSVQEELFDIFTNAKGRIILASSSSNIDRIQQIFDTAHEHDRKITIIRKNQDPIIDTAIKLNMLQVHKQLLVPPHKINQWSDEKVVILVTGTRCRPLQEIAKMATRSHKLTKIKESDTIAVAIKPTPGYEKMASKTIDIIFRTKADIYYGQKRIHVSGHASQGDLKLMLSMLQPQYLVPVHGEYRMQKAHESLAYEVGMENDSVLLLDNGEVVEFKGRTAKKAGKVPVGNVLIDGLGIGDVGNIVLRDRRLLSQDGILIVVVTLSKEKNRIVSGPEILSRGFVYVRESESLLETSTEIVTEILTQCISENIHDWSTLKVKIRESLSHFLFKKTKRRPMVLPIIMEV